MKIGYVGWIPAIRHFRNLILVWLRPVCWGECYCNGGSSSAGRMTGEPWWSTIIHLCPTRS